MQGGILEVSMELADFIEKIADEQDQILFTEAFQAYNSKLYRSAYIIFWLTCAESLKHKFQVCARRGDSSARDLYQKITNQEGRHAAVDKAILSYAQKYGLITDAECQQLEYIYTMRCIYAHPYKTSPTKKEVEYAINTIMSIVLTRPPLFTQGYVEELVSKLTNDECYLSDVENIVRSTAQQWLAKIEPSYHKMFFEKYIQENELLLASPVVLFRRRAQWILDEVLKKISFAAYDDEEWYNWVATCPQTILDVLQVESSGLRQIGDRARDYLVNTILKSAEKAPEYLNILIPYLKDQEFLGHNYTIIHSRLLELPLDVLRCTQLSIDMYLPAILGALQSGNFNRQNEVATFISRNRDSISMLSSEQQFELGIRIHEAAIHGAFSAQSYINAIASSPNEYPLDFIKGLVQAVVVLDAQGRCIHVYWSQIKVLSSLFSNISDARDLIENINKSIQEYFERGFYSVTYKKMLEEQYDLNQCNWLTLQ